MPRGISKRQLEHLVETEDRSSQCRSFNKYLSNEYKGVNYKAEALFVRNKFYKASINEGSV